MYIYPNAWLRQVRFSDSGSKEADVIAYLDRGPLASANDIISEFG